MALKTLVKVGNISNLSDARYCAGMGVDMLGYVAIEGQPNHVPFKLYQDIRGWVAGPSPVIELYGLTKNHSLEELLENYRPDFLEVSTKELDHLPFALEQSLIVAIHSHADLDQIKSWKGKIHYLQINEEQKDLIHEASKIAPVILSLQATSGLSLLNTLPIKGIALNGSAEVRPGYKDYDDLAEVLEKLEIDN